MRTPIKSARLAASRLDTTAFPARLRSILAMAAVRAFCLCCPALLYPCMSFHLFEPDEGRYAQIPREMLERGEWSCRLFRAKAYLDKPPLFYWLVMAAYSLFGFHEWSARLIPALAMHASVLVCYLLGRRVVGGREALWGAILLTVSPIFLGVGRLLTLDGVLTLWITTAILAAFVAQQGDRIRFGWWLVAAVACALGVLTKGPVALLLVAPPLWVHQRLVRSSASISLRGWAWFFGIVARSITVVCAVQCSGRVRGLFSLASQFTALRRAVRSREAGVVLCADRALWIVAGHVIDLAAESFPDVNRGVKFQEPMYGDGLPITRGIVVHFFLLTRGQQIADVRIAGVSAVVPGVGVLFGAYAMACLALRDRHDRGCLARARGCELLRHSPLRDD